MEDLLLRTSSACLQELTDLKWSLHSVNTQLQDLQRRVDDLSSSRAVADAGSSPEQGERLLAPAAEVAKPAPQPAPRPAVDLQGLCLLQDADLRDLFVAACEQGRLHLNLEELLDLAGTRGMDVEALLHTSLPREVQAGSIRAVMFRLAADSKVQISISRSGSEIATALAEDRCRGEDALSTVIFSPVFRRSCWPLLEAALRWCQQEQLTPALELLRRCVDSLLLESESFRDVDLLGLFGAAPVRNTPSVAVGKGGNVMVKWAAGVETPAEEASIQEVLPGVAECRETLSALLGAERELQQLHPADLLELLAVVRSAPLGLPEPVRKARGAVLLGAVTAPPQVSATVAVPASTPQRAASEDPPPAEPAAPELVAAQPQIETDIDGSAASASQVPTVQPTSEFATAVESMVNSPWEADPAPNPGRPEPISSDPTAPTAVEQRLGFIECFKGDLLKKRTLLLSQLNNLYKMRGGEELAYKLVGYEKLQDFLLDIPGLSLSGRGNRMQVQLDDPGKLEASRVELERQCSLLRVNEAGKDARALQFKMPEALPDRLLHKLYNVFMAADGHEIALRGFLTAWKNCYPVEQLTFRALGFRDIRGLLSQVAFVQKVGGKSETRYILKHSEVPQHLLHMTGDEANADPMCITIAQASTAEVSRPDQYLTVTKQPSLGQAPTGDLLPTSAATRRPAELSTTWVPTGTVGGDSRRLMPDANPVSRVLTNDSCTQSSSAVVSTMSMNSNASFKQGMVGQLSPLTLGSFQVPGTPSVYGGNGGFGEFDMSRANSRQNVEVVRTSSKRENHLHPDIELMRTGGRMEQEIEVTRTNSRRNKEMEVVRTGSRREQELEVTRTNSRRNRELEMIRTNSSREQQQRVMGKRRLPKAKKSANFFVSSPGAISSETRDAYIHQGKFDMCSVLQMQLPQDTASLVCDLSHGIVMVTNAECEDFFETAPDQSLVQCDILSLIHEDYKEMFSTCLTYLSITEKPRMEAQRLSILTRSGRSRPVCLEGEKLIGMLWQLDFWLEKVEG